MRYSSHTTPIPRNWLLWPVQEELTELHWSLLFKQVTEKQSPRVIPHISQLFFPIIQVFAFRSLYPLLHPGYQNTLGLVCPEENPVSYSGLLTTAIPWISQPKFFLRILRTHTGQWVGEREGMLISGGDAFKGHPCCSSIDCPGDREIWMWSLCLDPKRCFEVGRS